MILRAGYSAGVAVILYLALEPQPPQIGASSDKVNHILAFLAMSVSARVLWSRASLPRLFALLVALGTVIEVLQGMLPFGRDAEIMDLVADIAATVAGLGFGTLGLFMAGRLRGGRTGS